MQDARDILIAQQAEQLKAQAAEIVFLKARIEELEAKLNAPKKTSKNSHQPPSRDQKGNNRGEGNKGNAQRQGSLGRKGGGRALAKDPDEIISSKAKICCYCHRPFGEADHKLHIRYDKIDLPEVEPFVTRVERYESFCTCCQKITIAPAPRGMEEGSPFSSNITARAVYLRIVHAISYNRLSRIFGDLFKLGISEGALDGMFRRAKPRVDESIVPILARLRQSQRIYSDETGIRVDGKGNWNWTFQNEEVELHVIRPSRSRAVPREILDGHRPAIWVADLYSSQQGHADKMQICLAHQLRDCQHAIEAGDTIFAPLMKRLFLRAFITARRRGKLSDEKREQAFQRLKQRLELIMLKVPENRNGLRLKKRYKKHGGSLFTFMKYPEITPDNNSSERALRPIATYRKVTNGFRSRWGADFYAGIRSLIGTAARQGIQPFEAIKLTLAGNTLF